MDVFIARQPVFDRRKNVYAYKFKLQLQNEANEEVDRDKVRSSVLAQSFITRDITSLSKGKKVIFEFTPKMLQKRYAQLFPERTLIVEIERKAHFDHDLFAILKELKESGYKILLGSDVFQEGRKHFFDLADIIKLDLAFVSPNLSKLLATDWPPKILVNNINTHEEFEEISDCGFGYFKGDFIYKPESISTKAVSSREIIQLQLMSEISSPDLTIDDLEQIFKQDMALSYKLLKYLNSVYFGFAKEITSVRHGLSLLGLIKVKKLVTFILMSEFAKSKSEEVLLTSIIRANLCEMLADKVGFQERAGEVFLMGMFSVLEAMLNQKMEEILETLPLAQDIKDALLGKPGRLNDLYNLVVLCESGKWDKIAHYVKKLSLTKFELLENSLNAIKEANAAMAA